MTSSTVADALNRGTRLHPTPGTYVPWRNTGLVMSVAFAVLYLMSEVGALMAVNLYGAMAEELGLSASEVNWALLSTTIVGAATVALGARAGDVYGHRLMLLISLAIVTVGFAVSALAPTFAVLILGRALVGLLAFKPALILAIVQDRLEPANRHRAIALITGGLAVAVFVSFAIGGIFLEVGLSWRAAFGTAAVFIAVCFLFVLFFVPESDARSRATGSGGFDIPGVVLLGVGLVGICVALNQATAWGIASTAFWATLLTGLASAVAWVWWELHTAEPLVDLRLAASRRLWPAYAIWVVIGLVAFFLYTMVITYAISDPSTVNYGFGLTPLFAGFILLGVTVGGLVTSRLAPKMIGWWGPRATLLIGTTVFLAAFVWLLLFHVEVWHYHVGIMLFGLSVTTMITVSLAVLVGEAPKGKSAATTGLYIVLATVATSIGTALYGFAMSSETIPGIGAPAPAAFDLGYLITVIVSVFGVVAAFFLPKDSRAAEGANH